MSRGCARISPGSGHPRPSENGRVATSVPLITDNSRKARGSRESDDDDGGWARGKGAERCGKQGEEERSACGPRTGLVGKRKRGEGGWVVSMGPVEEPFSYSKQQRPAGTAFASAVSASPAIIYCCWRPSLRYNGQVIHPLSGYLPGKRPPPQAGSTRLLSSSPSAFPHRETRGRERERREERKLRMKWRMKRQEIWSAHTYFCAGYFRSRSLLCTSLEIALDHSCKSSPDRLDKNCHCQRVCQ